MPRVLLASASYDHTIRLWDAPTGVCWRTIQFSDHQVNKLEILPDKQYLAAAGNPHIRLYEINSNNPNPVTSFDGHTSNVTALGFHREGKWMFTGSEDKTIKIWDLRAPNCQREYECTAPVNTVVLHPNQAELISGDQQGNIRVWDLTANTCSRELVPAGDVSIRSLSVSSDATRLAAANNAGACFIWRLSNPPPDPVTGALSNDGVEFEPLRRLQAHDNYILKVSISPDGSKLATTSADQTVKLWSMSDFSLLRTLSGHQRWVWDGVFSHDSDFLVTASSDHSLRLWDLESGETIRQYTGHSKAVVCVALNEDLA